MTGVALTWLIRPTAVPGTGRPRTFPTGYRALLKPSPLEAAARCLRDVGSIDRCGQSVSQCIQIALASLNPVWTSQHIPDSGQRGAGPLRRQADARRAREQEQQAQLLSSMRTPRERIASKSRSRSQSGSMSASNLAAWSTLSMATRVPSLIWIR